MRARMVLKRLAIYTLAMALLAVMVYSGTQVVLYLMEGRAQRQLDNEWGKYRPSLPDTSATQPTTPEEPLESLTINSGVAEAQQENSDVVGWITIPDTRIDYPFVLGKDNSFYLHHNVAKVKASAGALFLDYRTDRDFFNVDYDGGQANAVIYGHQMKNGSMFADVRKFREKSYFDTHPEGFIFLPEGTFRVRFFAFVSADAYDEQLYGIWSNAAEYMAYARGREQHGREVSIPDGGKIVVLSTCSYESETARAVLLGVVELVG